MLRLSQIALPLEVDEGALVEQVARRLNIAPERIRDARVVRRALDARHKPRLLRIVTVDFTVDDEEALLREASIPQLTRVPEEAPLELLRARRPGRCARTSSSGASSGALVSCGTDALRSKASSSSAVKSAVTIRSNRGL